MALFNKFFFSSSSKRTTVNSNHPQQYLSQFPFNADQVRILLYRECDNRGRRLLFDSNAVEKVDLKKFDSEKIQFFRGQQTVNSKKQQDYLSNHPLFSNASGYVEFSDGFAYKHSRPTSSDITGIGEMIFGALAMSFRGTSLKIHWLQSPVRLLCSQVFLTPLQTKFYSGKESNETNSRRKDSEDSGASFNSFTMPFSVCVNGNLNTWSDKDLTNPLMVPHVKMSLENAQLYAAPMSAEDSGYSVNEVWTSSATDNQFSQYSTRSSLGSVFSNDPESLRKFSLDFGETIVSNNRSSDISVKRRITRNISTSFETRNSVSDFIGFIGDNYPATTTVAGGSDGCVSRFRRTSGDAQYSCSNPELIRNYRTSGDSFLSTTKTNRQLMKRSKLGLAVCITMSEHFEKEMEQFCCEHIALFESMLCRLRASAETAYINHRSFLQIMVSAWQSTATWIQDLFTAPRVYNPVWLNISSIHSEIGDTKNTKYLSEQFIKELSWLLSFADTKNTNFFISTMLTALLTYHLGWVSTIASFKLDPQYSKIEELINEQKVKLMEVSHKHPYNALWAQMGDLYGSIGNPPRISRTIIYGTERHVIEKLLHVLTYFIRCGEVKRTPKIEIIDNENLDVAVLRQNSIEITTTNTINNNNDKEIMTKKSALKRSPTCFKSLWQNDNNQGQKQIENEISSSKIVNLGDFLKQNSEEEKAVGAMLTEQKPQESNQNVAKKAGKIRLTITTPDNIEMTVNYSESSIIENQPNDMIPKTMISDSVNINQKAISNKNTTSAGQAVGNSLRKSISMSKIAPMTSKPDTPPHSSFSNLSAVTETTNSIPQNDADGNQNLDNGVLFVLGDNEALVNIKKSNEDLAVTTSNNSEDLKSNQSQSSTKTNDDIQHNRTCCHHHKKHSGVKFNFEQYPQIATNYMKNKNLDLSSYDFLDKSSKFHEYFKFEPSTSAFQVTLPPITQHQQTTITSSPVNGNEQQTNGKSTNFDSENNDTCEVCKYCSNIDESRIFQTPSNATELEFETEEDNYPSPIVQAVKKNENEKTSVNSIPSVSNKSSEEVKNIEKIIPKLNDSNQNINQNVLETYQQFDEKDSSKFQFDLVQLPLPGVKDNSKTINTVESINLTRPGFIPSLLIGVSDHYIPDMILQGIMAAPETWELKLKRDLTLSSHSATLTSSPIENIAIIADMSKWDVKVISSSQSCSLPHRSGISGNPVGMSQLVSTMLETVQVMSSSGMSAFECLSYIESKLQEMYLQSETLAALLLATEFCSLNTVTTALNLSENDVPLLLSVASVHSPQVTRKYGISFR